MASRLFFGRHSLFSKLQSGDICAEFEPVGNFDFPMDRFTPTNKYGTSTTVWGVNMIEQIYIQVL
jgi:hypothetical protein